MDRFTAPSTAPRPHPLSSLTNIPKDQKRHCRILSARMVNLSLAQMKAALDLEEQEQTALHDKEERENGHHHVSLDCNEQDADKAAACDGKMEMRKRRSAERKRARMEETRVKRESFHEMIASVDDLLSFVSPREVPPRTTIDKVARIRPAPLSTAKATIFAERERQREAWASDAHMEKERKQTIAEERSSYSRTISTQIPPTPRPHTPKAAIHKPSPPKILITNPTHLPTTAPPRITLSPPSKPLPVQPSSHPNPLHCNPPSATELAHAAALSNAHRAARQMALRDDGPITTLAAYDAMTQYGIWVRRRKTTRNVRFARAVMRGVRGIFG